MKIISWNVNGLRAVWKKGFELFLQEQSPDILAIQETKMKQVQKDFSFGDYFEYWNEAEKAGYSGTLILTKEEPLQVLYGIGDGLYNDEGRVITLEFEDFYFVNAYVPNAKRDLSRIPYRMTFEDHMRAYLLELDESKPVIYTGDFNVAHQEIDLTYPKQNRGNAGFTDEERAKMTELLEAGFIDTYRMLYPTKIGYTWWSYMFDSRKNNVGWRIDYFVISERLRSQIKDSLILSEVEGSDHCPIVLDVSI